MSRMKWLKANQTKVLKRSIGVLMTGILISIQPASLLAETQDGVAGKQVSAIDFIGMTKVNDHQGNRQESIGYGSIDSNSIVSKILTGYTKTGALSAAYDPNWNDKEKEKDSKGKNTGKDGKQSQSVTLPPYTPSYRQPVYDFREFKLESATPEKPVLIITSLATPEEDGNKKKVEDLRNSLLQTGSIAKIVDTMDKSVNGMGEAVGRMSVLEQKMLQENIADINRIFFKPDGTFQAGRTQKEYFEALTKAKDGASSSSSKMMKFYGKAAPVLTVVSVGLNGYVVYNDVKDLATGNLKNRTTTGKVLETTGLVADAGVAVWGIVVTGCAIAGVTVGSIPLAVGVAVGLTAGAIHSDWFADWFDEYGRKTDEAVADGVGIIKEWWNLTKETTSDNLDVLSDYLKELFGIRTKVPNNVNCYKPNIYIYTEAPTNVEVTFARPDLLTKTIPAYENGWHVEAKEGLLTEKREMAENISGMGTYEYLFYESETQMHYFQKEEAWLINADTRQQQYEQILRAYGFNEQEIKDFVEFWTEKLPQGQDYLMYPQDTAIVNKAMPMQVMPEPESMERMWFVFTTDDGQEYAIPQAEKIDRQSYAVVEWGGVIEDEQ